MNLALFGGSFDPPHLGHSSIIKMALNTLVVDKLIIMPTYISPFKSEFSASPNTRLEWIKKIWGDLDRVEISKFEIEQNRPVPTIETAKYLKNLYNPTNFYLLLGADHMPNLHKWHGYDELKEIVKFVVAKRDEYKIPPRLTTIDTQVHISSSMVRSGVGLEMIDERVRDEIIKFYKGR